MSRISTVQELVAHTGNGSLVAPRNRFYVFTWDFASVAANSHKSVAVKGDSSHHFVADYLLGGAWLSGAGAAPPTAVAGTPLIHDADASPIAATGNQMPSLWHLAVEISTNDGSWQTGPIRWPLLFGTARQPMVPLFVPHIAAGITTKITLYNHSAAAVDAQIAWPGHFIG